MIIEYLRPKTIPEALTLLNRKDPITYPLGGGTYLNRPSDDEFAVVDLQALDLGEITRNGNSVMAGATVTLQAMVEYAGLAEDLVKAVKLETTYNLRQVATIAGTLVTANGRSPAVTVLLALDTGMEIEVLDKAPTMAKLGDWLPARPNRSPGNLITKVSFPANVEIAYESIARTPADQAIVCAAVCQWPSGRTRLVLGGYGKAPILAMDGTEADGLEAAARNAYSHAGDEWASAEYRAEMAGVLASRCLDRISQRT